MVVVRPSSSSSRTTPSPSTLTSASPSSTSPLPLSTPTSKPPTTAASNPPRRARSSLGAPTAVRKKTSASATLRPPPLTATVVVAAASTSAPVSPSTSRTSRTTRTTRTSTPSTTATKATGTPVPSARKPPAASRRSVSPAPLILQPKLAPPSVAAAAAARSALRSRDRNAALPSRPPLHRPTITLHRSPSPSPSVSSSTSTTTFATSISSLSSAHAQQHTPRTPSAAAAMGYDKDNNTPRKPMLASRPFTRPPLTPKIASTPAGLTPTLAATAGGGPRTPTLASPGGPHTVTVTPLSRPLARRSTGASSSSPSPAQQPYYNRDNTASPVPPYLNNITPRSGSRQSRVDNSGTTTPSGTPTHAGFADPDAKFFYASEAKPASAGVAAPTVTAAATTTQTLAASPSLGPPSRGSTFFYANGTTPLASPTYHNPPSAATAATAAASPATTDHLAAKFVHANGDAIVDRRSSVPPQQTPSSSPSFPPPPQSQQSQSQSRPLSPVKLSPYPLQRSDSMRSAVLPASVSLNAATAMASPPLAPTSPSGGGSGGSSNGGSNHLQPRSRSTFSSSLGSNGSSTNGGDHHYYPRKGSLTVADPPTVARLLQTPQPPSSAASSPASSPAPTGAATATSGLASLFQAVDDFGEESGEEDDENNNDNNAAAADDKSSVANASNTSSGGGGKESNPLDDLVRTARRERKVQDLEITNASLEAINRSLERQLRKQKAEIRQFRRLSRAGRLSSAPVALLAKASSDTLAIPASSRIASTTSTVEGPLQDTDRLLGGGADAEADDVDKEEYPSEMETSFNEDEEEEDEDEDDEEEEEDGGSDDNIHRAKNSTRRRRDERRLQLDLAKHRQLLVDSQKINQSIKRCMNWTEALIADGRKALAFQVRVSEVQLGGRVLAADEVEERRRKRAEREQLGLGATLPVDHDAHSMLGDGASTLGVSDVGSVGDDGDGGEVDEVDEVSADDASTFSAVDVDGMHSVHGVHADDDDIPDIPIHILHPPDDQQSDTHDNESFSPVSHSRSVRFDDDDDVAAADGLPLDGGTTAATPKLAQGAFQQARH